MAHFIRKFRSWNIKLYPRWTNLGSKATFRRWNLKLILASKWVRSYWAKSLNINCIYSKVLTKISCCWCGFGYVITASKHILMHDSYSSSYTNYTILSTLGVTVIITAMFCWFSFRTAEVAILRQKGDSSPSAGLEMTGYCCGWGISLSIISIIIKYSSLAIRSRKWVSVIMQCLLKAHGRVP